MIRKIPASKIKISMNEADIEGGKGNALVYTWKNESYLIFDDKDDVLSAPICKHCGSVTAPDNKARCNHCGAPVNQ